MACWSCWDLSTLGERWSGDIPSGEKCFLILEIVVD